MNRKLFIVLLAGVASVLTLPEESFSQGIEINIGPRPHRRYRPYRPRYDRRPRRGFYFEYRSPVVVQPTYVRPERVVVVPEPVVIERQTVSPYPAQTMQSPQTVQSFTSAAQTVPASPSAKAVPPAPRPDVRPIEPFQANVVQLRIKGDELHGPVKPFTVRHYYTGVHFTIDVPAWCEPKKIEYDKDEVELKYPDGEIEIKFRRDGSAVVDYDF